MNKCPSGLSTSRDVWKFLPDLSRRVLLHGPIPPSSCYGTLVGLLLPHLDVIIRNDRPYFSQGFPISRRQFVVTSFYILWSQNPCLPDYPPAVAPLLACYRTPACLTLLLVPDPRLSHSPAGS
ncbi:unnamed protein product [Boreogadus saida]